MKNKLFLIICTALINALLLNEIESLTTNSSELFIYGTVTLENGDAFTGQIRWGKEEIFWFDFFNSSKPENDYLDYLSDDELDIVSDCNRGNNSLFNGIAVNWGDCSNTHSFATQFGDIKRIDVRSKSRVTVTLKNGESFKLKGGSNDIGATVQVHDAEIGLIKLEWKEIEHVEFSPTPAVLDNYFGDPLYGVVHTEQGSYTGYLQWDHDERVTLDELNGEYEDGDLDIQFGNIKSIKKIWGGSEVTLNSGRRFELDGSNDVDKNNRGIIVNMPGHGRVDIDWDEFEMIEFVAAPNQSGIHYRDFKGEEKLEGTIHTKAGTKLKGHIVYDLDEAYQLEMLNGMDDDIEYFIPFSNVKNITRNGRRHTKVTTTSGQTLELDDKVDVDENNDGVLVFESTKSDDATYVPWDDIESIDFN